MWDVDFQNGSGARSGGRIRKILIVLNKFSM